MAATAAAAKRRRMLNEGNFPSLYLWHLFLVGFSFRLSGTIFINVTLAPWNSRIADVLHLCQLFHPTCTTFIHLSSSRFSQVKRSGLTAFDSTTLGDTILTERSSELFPDDKCWRTPTGRNDATTPSRNLVSILWATETRLLVGDLRRSLLLLLSSSSGFDVCDARDGLRHARQKRGVRPDTSIKYRKFGVARVHAFPFEYAGRVLDA